MTVILVVCICAGAVGIIALAMLIERHYWLKKMYDELYDKFGDDLLDVLDDGMHEQRRMRGDDDNTDREQD